MGEVQNAVQEYKELIKNEYEIKICDKDYPEKNSVFVLAPKPEHFHHLAGFQHLTDLQGIWNPRESKSRFYRRLERGDVDEAYIMSSVFYYKIAERIRNFSYLKEILAPGKGKIIVDFNRSLADSDIEARYFLFKREGNPMYGDVIYYNLFIGYDEEKTGYYSATYIVEKSTLYIRNQMPLNCEIKVVHSSENKK